MNDFRRQEQITNYLKASKRKRRRYWTLIIAFAVSILLIPFYSSQKDKRANKSHVKDEGLQRIKDNIESRKSQSLLNMADTYIVQGTGEVFRLFGSGNATWMWQGTKKYGTWTGYGNQITIEVKGNTGYITETFRVEGNYLYKQ